MTSSKTSKHLKLTPEDNQRLAKLCGETDKNLRLIEAHLGVEMNNRGNEFEIIGMPLLVKKACDLLKQLYRDTKNKEITAQDIQLVLKSVEISDKDSDENKQKALKESALYLQEATIHPRTRNQRYYMNAIAQFDINFGIGPSGTGKTFLAVACALSALEKEQVTRIVLVRPAVEAGESLGFLPGDLSQKIDPYLRPLYDALYEMLGIEKVNRLVSKGIIEVAPLAYMRGRTLNDSFVILDEAQNSTREQMKMFLTRIGFGSKAVITGDITQIDLPNKVPSGLRHATHLLSNIEAIHFTFFRSEDVVRHPLVQTIIEVYEKEEESK